MSTWYLWGFGGWSTVETLPAHYGLAEATLLGVELATGLGWLISPRGLEPGLDAINVDAYQEEIPNLEIGFLDIPYWADSGDSDAQDYLAIPAWLGGDR